MSDSLLAVETLASELRDQVNTPRVRTRLEREGENFWQALSSLDLLGDTAAAIRAHDSLADSIGDSSGDRYLSLYGLMTAFQLQQDAGTNLAKALGLAQTAFDYTDLTTVRNARIAAAGHTSRRERQVDEPTFYFVNRSTLSGEGFELGIAEASGGYRSEVINLSYLKILQDRGMSGFLADLLANAKREEMEHRRQFVGRSLAAGLDGHSYEFEKISSTGFGGGQPDTIMAPISVQVLQRALSAFEADLEERGLSVKSFMGVAGIWPILTGCLDRLENYFRNPPTDHLDPLDAYAVAHLLRKTWRELQEMASEIDAEYGASNGAVEPT